MPPKDDAGGDLHERFVNEREAFESNAQAPEVMETAPKRGLYAAIWRA